MSVIVVIPARLESTRLPRKMLLDETGRPLIQHTYEAVERWGKSLIVATDSDEIYSAVVAFGGMVIQTGEHPNGTSRMAEVVSTFPFIDIYVNVQGDEPEIEPELIDELIDELERHPEWDCVTAACPLYTHDHDNPHCVKARVNPESEQANDFFRRGPCLPDVWLHIGIYAYRRDALLRYAAAGPCPREQSESLEQLRALHIGLRMGVVLTDYHPAGIDTREDYEAFVKRWKEKAAAWYEETAESRA